MPAELRETVLAHAADLRALAREYRLEAHAIEAEARLGADRVRCGPPAR